MTSEYIWLFKVILAHLLTDFVFQPKSWVIHRNTFHFGSSRLYLHGLVTAAAAFLLAGAPYWPAVLVIAITHTIIDGWKSYRKQNAEYFLLDQALHLVIIVTCWIFYFVDGQQLSAAWETVANSRKFWLYTTAVIFLTTPAGILIGFLTREWRDKIHNAESLANAGKWIGIIERLIVFIFVLLGQYAAISLLVAAKGIIRFNEKERPEVKTEYLVIGTLMSIGLSLILAIAIRKLVYW